MNYSNEDYNFISNNDAPHTYQQTFLNKRLNYDQLAKEM